MNCEYCDVCQIGWPKDSPCVHQVNPYAAQNAPYYDKARSKRFVRQANKQEKILSQRTPDEVENDKWWEEFMREGPPSP